MDLRKFQEAEGGSNHVLRVVVENMTYPTTLEVLTHLFSQFGNVLKVITFTKNSNIARLCFWSIIFQTNSKHSFKWTVKAMPKLPNSPLMGRMFTQTAAPLGTGAQLLTSA